MKTDRIIYWATTIIATAMVVVPAFFYFSPYMITAIRSLGFPDYFRIELAIGKFIGALIICIPVVPKMFKEWVYVAFGITLLSGSLAHAVVDGWVKGAAPLIPFAILCVSYYYFRKLNSMPLG